MRINTGSDHQTVDQTAPPRSEATTRPPSWPLALASFGACLAAAAGIVLIAILA